MMKEKTNSGEEMMEKTVIKINRLISKIFLFFPYPGVNFLRKKICKSLAPKINEEVFCPTIYKTIMKVNPSNSGLEKNIYYYGEYEDGTISFLEKNLKRGDIFLDVGANIGLMSCSMSKKIGEKGKIYAIEPEIKNFNKLKENIKINNINNIHVHKIALSSNEGESILYGDKGEASLIDYNNELKREKVKLTTMDIFLKNKEIPNAIKIDVEGYELEVLKGGIETLKEHGPVLCIEVSHLHPQKGSISEMFALLKKLNYKIFKLKKGKTIRSKLIEITREGELPFHDNIFCIVKN